MKGIKRKKNGNERDDGKEEKAMKERNKTQSKLTWKDPGHGNGCITFL